MLTHETSNETFETIQEEKKEEIVTNPWRAAKRSSVKTELEETVRSESTSCELSLTVTCIYSRHCCRHSCEDLASDLLFVIALWLFELKWSQRSLMRRPGGI